MYSFRNQNTVLNICLTMKKSSDNGFVSPSVSEADGDDFPRIHVFTRMNGSHIKLCFNPVSHFLDSFYYQTELMVKFMTCILE